VHLAHGTLVLLDLQMRSDNLNNKEQEQSAEEHLCLQEIPSPFGIYFLCDVLNYSIGKHFLQ
jgi:hypothetical protein